MSRSAALWTSTTCIDPLLVERIAYWEIGKENHELTEKDWKNYFLGARECDPVDMTKLCQNMAKLQMGGSTQSAGSRVSKLVSDFEAILVRLSMGSCAELEPKLTVDFLMAAITPSVVQKLVKELMKLNENLLFKKDTIAFKPWLSEYMKRYGEFEPLVQAGPAPPAKSTEKPKAINVDKVPLANVQPVNGKSAYFKCLSPDHSVFKCSKCAPGEAQLLMNRAKVVWADAEEGRSVAVAKKVRVVEPSEATAIMCESRVVCTANQTVALDASFDSDADQSAIRMLPDAGHDVAVMDLPSPVVVPDFVGPSRTVTQEVKLDLKFDTEAGPLIQTDSAHYVQLGYDRHSMLREAVLVCSKYFMADVESTSGVVKAVMLTTKQELTDDLAEQESWKGRKQQQTRVWMRGEPEVN
ncbi:hypothetical protein DYB28_001836 [Aphanomyces astaci]|uniref:Uncharacterized protein n=1 Tax=Aphanomyces astaci TaxID=112090 RepID=A0A9X8HGP2_APHAT|nr:hypothetical protein DYB28_001836 [Aphanomyces astaci]